MRTRTRYLTAIPGALLLLAACAGQPSAPSGTVAPKAQAPAAAPAASEAGKPSLAPFIPVGKFAIEPRTAPWGALVTASATGMAPNTGYDVLWADVTGKWKLSEDGWLHKGREFTTSFVKLASPKTDGAGAFEATFKVPEGFGFLHDVLVNKAGTTETVNKFGFNVEMTASITPASGPVGTPINIEVKGIGTQPLQNSWLLSYDNKFTGWLSAVTTRGHAKAVIPAAGSVGTHYINIGHGHMSEMYLNPEQSPQPDRPRFKFPFTITEGAAVQPPAAETQRVAPDIKLPEKGNFWFEPNKGVVGSKTTLRATGLKPNTELSLVWHTSAGIDWVAGARPDKTEVVGKAKTDARGDLAWEYAIPDGPGGLHPFTAREADKVVATTAYLLYPNIMPLSKTSGPSGTEIQLQVYGMYWTDTGKITHVVYDNASVGYACAFNSGGNIRIKLTMVGEPGWHFIDLYPGMLQGEEQTPMNYRVPQLTALADHPGEKMPIWRVAFLITAP